MIARPKPEAKPDQAAGLQQLMRAQALAAPPHVDEEWQKWAGARLGEGHARNWLNDAAGAPMQSSATYMAANTVSR